MPRMRRVIAPAMLATALAAGCRFDANYGGGTYTCSDGVCPPGLACVGKVCVAPGDGGDRGDAAADAPSGPDAAPPDAHPALSCGDPGQLARGAPASASGSTQGGVNHVSAMCGALVMNGPDAVYRITAQAGDRLDVTVTGDSIVKAYVLASCPTPPATPICEGGAYTQAGAVALGLTNLAAGTHYVLVDDENAATGGSYTVTVDLRP